MTTRSASLRRPAVLLAGAVGLLVALPQLRAWAVVPDVVFGTVLAVLLVAGGAELAMRLPRPSDPERRRLTGLGVSIVGMVGVLCCAVAASDVADAWPAGVRAVAVAAAVFGLPLLAGGSAMVRQAEHALHHGVITYPRRAVECRP